MGARAASKEGRLAILPNDCRAGDDIHFTDARTGRTRARTGPTRQWRMQGELESAIVVLEPRQKIGEFPQSILRPDFGRLRCIPTGVEIKSFAAHFLSTGRSLLDVREGVEFFAKDGVGMNARPPKLVVIEFVPMRRRVVGIGDAVPARFHLGTEGIIALDKVALKRRQSGDAEIMRSARGQTVAALRIVKRASSAPAQAEL